MKKESREFEKPLIDAEIKQQEADKLHKISKMHCVLNTPVIGSKAKRFMEPKDSRKSGETGVFLHLDALDPILNSLPPDKINDILLEYSHRYDEWTIKCKDRHPFASATPFTQLTQQIMEFSDILLGMAFQTLSDSGKSVDGKAEKGADEK